MLRFVPIHLNRRSKESAKWLASESNKRDLKQFLAIHGIELEDVTEIDFSHLNFKPHVLVRDEDGNVVLSEDRHSAKVEIRTVKYLCEKPSFK